MMHGSINGTFVRIVGMSRSGNHAVINWILAQLSGRWVFLNCTEPRTNPFGSARLTDEGRCYRTNDPRFDLDAHLAGQLSPKDYLLTSHEDTYLGPAFGPEAGRMQRQWVGPSDRRIDVVILRDPFNLFASRRRFGHQANTSPAARRIWKQHARAFLGEARALGGPVLGISYNDWVCDRGYRAGIARELGLAFTDDGRDKVARCGGGSSFDGFEAQPGRMDLLERWRHYRHDPDFRKLFDPELIALSRRIFGPPPADLLPGVQNSSPDLTSIAEATEGNA